MKQSKKKLSTWYVICIPKGHPTLKGNKHIEGLYIGQPYTGFVIPEEEYGTEGTEKLQEQIDYLKNGSKGWGFTRAEVWEVTAEDSDWPGHMPRYCWINGVTFIRCRYAHNTETNSDV